MLDDASIDSAAIEPVSLPNEAPREPRDGAISSQSARAESNFWSKLPLPAWLSGYDRGNLRGDVAAGLTTAVMLVPQAMAYAMLAGLPPSVGLYASIGPLIAYALLGTSRELAVGPVAVVSLLVASGVGAMADAGSAHYIALAVALAGMVGVIKLVLGLVRGGFLVRFLSHPVVSGFTSAAALIIAASQLPNLLGVQLPRTHNLFALAPELFSAIPATHLWTFGIGAVSVAILLLLKRFAPRFPRALVVVVGGTFLAWGFDLSAVGVSTVGDVPSGLPLPGIPDVGAGELLSLLPTALVITAVGFMESISIARAFARRRGYSLDSNRELLGLGLANIVAGIFRGYPVTGGFSRTAVNASAGARTPAASVITALVVAATLLMLTPLFVFLPKAVLAAIIMTAVIGLVDVHEVRRLWRVDKSDLALLGLTFFATMTVGVEEGLAVGVIGSALGVVLERMRPRVVELALSDDTGPVRLVDPRHDVDVDIREDVRVVRVDSDLFYGNVDALADGIESCLETRETPPSEIFVVIESMHSIDTSAAETFGEVVSELLDYPGHRIEVSLVGVRPSVATHLEDAGVFERLGDDRVFGSLEEALTARLPAHARQRGARPRALDDVEPHGESPGASVAPRARGSHALMPEAA